MLRILQEPVMLGCAAPCLERGALVSSEEDTSPQCTEGHGNLQVMRHLKLIFSFAKGFQEK